MTTHPIFDKWPAAHPDRLQLFGAPTPNGVKVSIMLCAEMISSSENFVTNCMASAYF